jgi:hypothetical protein
MTPGVANVPAELVTSTAVTCPIIVDGGSTDTLDESRELTVTCPLVRAKFTFTTLFRFIAAIRAIIKLL